MKSAAMYVHFPYCLQKCIYCDFYSITNQESIKLFLGALIKEFERYTHHSFYANIPFSTFYLGGGTPSLCRPDDLGSMVNSLKRNYDWIDEPEWSIEANPGTVDRDFFSEIRDLGFTRVTLGIQSFEPAELTTLTRIHTVSQAEATLRVAKETDLNIGIDVIFGIPGQTPGSWENTLNRVVEWAPHHVSMYGLTYENSTPLWRLRQRGEIQPCAEETERTMYLTGKQCLEDAGYQCYEISNFAVPGHRSKHNRKYWDGSPYLGCGPSAHSYNGFERWWNVSDVDDYISRLQAGNSVLDQREQLTTEQRLAESVLLGLRRVEGLSVTDFEKQLQGGNNIDMSTVLDRLGGIDSVEPFTSSPDGKLLTRFNNRLALTEEGLLIYDSLCERLIGEITA